MFPSAALSYRWFLNEFPNFLKRSDGRWFVSQATGNLYVAKAEHNDTGSYFCFTTISMDISTKSTFSRANQLTVLPIGREALEESLRFSPCRRATESSFGKFNFELVFVLFFQPIPGSRRPSSRCASRPRRTLWRVTRRSWSASPMESMFLPSRAFK